MTYLQDEKTKSVISFSENPFKLNWTPYTLVEITLHENNKQIFASRYMTILPSKEELVKIVEEEEKNNEK